MTRSLRVLVVDDDVDNANSLGELFELEGHRPLVVHDGESAVAAYAREDFDIAFMDVMMPGKNGVESFFEIRSLRPDAKIYMMTGYSVEQLLQQAVDGGAMGVFSKPVNLYRILEAVARIDESGIVLVSDDSPEFASELSELINREGYRCALAHTGSDALARVEAGDVDVLVLDLKLPLIYGIGVCGDMKRLGLGVPTVIVADRLGEGEADHALFNDVVVTGVLNKPFDPMLLMAKLEKLVA
jgi:two-component system, NtrC family, response regulator HydG